MASKHARWKRDVQFISPGLTGLPAPCIKSHAPLTYAPPIQLVAPIELFVRPTRPYGCPRSCRDLACPPDIVALIIYGSTCEANMRLIDVTEVKFNDACEQHVFYLIISILFNL